VALESSDFTLGGLSQSSRVRPNRLFTADESLIIYRAGHISDTKLGEALNRLIAILSKA
jgi:mRNA interferase MazF